MAVIKVKVHLPRNEKMAVVGVSAASVFERQLSSYISYHFAQRESLLYFSTSCQSVYFLDKLMMNNLEIKCEFTIRCMKYNSPYVSATEAAGSTFSAEVKERAELNL